MEMDDTPNNSKNAPATNSSIDVYAVQCGNCFKWRVIPTQEEFEDLRSRFVEEPFYCDLNLDISCDDPGDIEYDASRTWVIDKPNLPKTPAGFQRSVVLRKDYSKLDVYYVTPTGKRLRATPGIASFLEEHPEYKDISVSDFSFTVPKIMEETIPENVERKGSASANKKSKQ